jgi:hypothetical protein
MKTTTDEIALDIVRAWRAGTYKGGDCQADAALQSAINDQLELIYRRTRQMEEIGKLLREQDNRITDQPMFIVQQKQLTYGVDDAYTDLYHWCHKDGEGTADEVLAKRLDEKERQGKSTGQWEKIGYVETWEFVTACFTEQGCIDYLKRNGHNLKETRIYADGSYRNEEYQAVREFLMGMPEPGATGPWDKLAEKIAEQEEELARARGIVADYQRIHAEQTQMIETLRAAAAAKEPACEWTECPEDNPKATRTMWKGACGAADLFPRTGPTGTCRCGKPIKVTA